MKTLLVIAVMTCVFVMGQAQTPDSDCQSRLSGLSSCISQLANAGGDFCDNCANQLIDYYRDCADGMGVDAVQRGKLTSAEIWLNIIIITVAV